MVGMAGQFQQVEGGVAEAGHDLRAGAGADLAAVLVEGDVANVVRGILDHPVSPQIFGDLLVVGVGDRETGHNVDGFPGLFAGVAVAGHECADAGDAQDLDRAWEPDPATVIYFGGLQGAGLEPTVPAWPAAAVQQWNIPPGQGFTTCT